MLTPPLTFLLSMTVITNLKATKKQLLSCQQAFASKLHNIPAPYYLEHGLETRYRKICYLFRQGNKALWTNTPKDYINKLQLLGIAALLLRI